MRLTEHFTLEELINSSVASTYKIDNTPRDGSIVENLKALCVNVLEPARVVYGKSITVSSGYRCPQLNEHKAIRGKKTSQHTKGEAADLVCDDLKKLFQIIKSQGNFDQLLFEKNSKGVRWIHVSYKRNGTNRKQAIENYNA